MNDDAIPPLSYEAGAECIGVEILTNAMLRERGYRNSGHPFELAFLRRDGEWFTLPVASLSRVREIISELSLSTDAHRRDVREHRG